MSSLSSTLTTTLPTTNTPSTTITTASPSVATSSASSSSSPPSSSSSACKLISPNDVAQPFITSLKSIISSLPRRPLLVAFLANADPAAAQYAEWTRRTAESCGYAFELRRCERTELEEKIVEANEQQEVSGIMVYYPVFGGSMDQYLQNIVSPRKDVEGLCHTYRYNLYHNIRFLDPPSNQQKCIIPCTPLAILKILEFAGVYNRVLTEGNRLHGRTITVINRSEVVGRPLAALLANDGARVYSFDEFGALLFSRGAGLKLKRHEVAECKLTLEEAMRESDVVITGVPSANYKIATELLRPGAVAVNFSTQNNFQSDVVDKASLYVSSVGKVTVAMLLRNLLRLAEYQQGRPASI